MQRVLFLCSGNYYRSRFAEILFNVRAHQKGLAWVADSRALAIGRIHFVNEGPISPHVLAGLQERRLEAHSTRRFPIQACEADLAGSDVVIAMKEAEHRPMIDEVFPLLAHRVEYWHVHDQDLREPKLAMKEIEQHVEELIARLAGLPESPAAR